MNTMLVELGDEVLDRVTGYQGIVIAYSRWRYNTDSVGIQKRTVIDGKVDGCFWLDVSPRMEILGKGEMKDMVIEPEKHDFNFLDVVKDTITSFKGKIIGFTTWSSGCVRASVASEELDKDGKPYEQWFAVTQLTLVKKAKPEKEERKPGGPTNNPKVY